ncbi:unnamed protein product [Linum tenue]|uniref:Uncharacterized protein n=1 Tax=Linum tenue TaxID=586396 RepID=A0AAV0QHU9_9ROSI|nr:unnamed protein product [Linum tenue]
MAYLPFAAAVRARESAAVPDAATAVPVIFFLAFSSVSFPVGAPSPRRLRGDFGPSRNDFSSNSQPLSGLLFFVSSDFLFFLNFHEQHLGLGTYLVPSHSPKSFFVLTHSCVTMFPETSKWPSSSPFADLVSRVVATAAAVSSGSEGAGSTLLAVSFVVIGSSSISVFLSSGGETTRNDGEAMLVAVGDDVGKEIEAAASAVTSSSSINNFRVACELMIFGTLMVKLPSLKLARHCETL